MKQSVWESLAFKNSEEMYRALAFLEENGFDVECKSLYQQLCEAQLLDMLDSHELRDAKLTEDEIKAAIEEMTDIVYGDSKLDNCLMEYAYDAVAEVSKKSESSEH